MRGKLDLNTATTSYSTPTAAVVVLSSLIRISTENTKLLKMAQNASTKFTDNYELKEELGK